MLESKRARIVAANETGLCFHHGTKLRCTDQQLVGRRAIEMQLMSQFSMGREVPPVSRRHGLSMALVNVWNEINAILTNCRSNTILDDLPIERIRYRCLILSFHRELCPVDIAFVIITRR